MSALRPPANIHVGCIFELAMDQLIKVLVILLQFLDEFGCDIENTTTSCRSDGVIPGFVDKRTIGQVFFVEVEENPR